MPAPDGHDPAGSSPRSIAQETGGETRDPDVLYENGAYREALDIWMLRAFEGDPQSQFRVGVLFGEGKGVAPDFEQSAYWFTQAARQGHAAAQYNLGHAYYSGGGVKQSEADALTWWEAAAKGGHELAQYNMGRAYYMGIGTAKEAQLARFWFSQAAANGEPRSRELLEKLGWEPVAAVHLAQPEDSGSQASAIPVLALPELETVHSVNRPDDLADSWPDDLADNRADLRPSDPTVNRPAISGNDPGSTPPPKIAVSDSTRAPSMPAAGGAQEKSPDATMVPVYSTPGTGGLLLGVVAEDANWRIISRDGTWLRVTRTPGFPVWIHRDHVVISDGTATIEGDRVKIRAAPMVSESSDMGTVHQGQSFDVISRQGEWIRIVSPTNIAAWVSEQNLGKQALNATSPGTGRPSAWRTVGEPYPAGGSLKDDEGWLFSQSPDSYTIQIISLADEQGIVDFVKDLSLDGDAHYFTTAVEDALSYVLRYGAYASQEAAFAASSDLPLGGQAIWIRNLGALQQDRCEALEKVPAMVRADLAKWCSGLVPGSAN